MNIAAQLLVLTDELLWYYRIIFTAVIPHYFYRYRGVTVNFSPSPRYYREIFPIYRGITVVTVELPLSPLPCHSLIQEPVFNKTCQLPACNHRKCANTYRQE